MSDYEPDYDEGSDGDIDIDLDFGADVVEPEAERVIVDQGIYALLCTKVEVRKTRKTPDNGQLGENMIVCTWTIEDHEKYAGVELLDHVVQPGKYRNENDHKTWNRMMNMFRDKLEGITQKEFRENNMQINPKKDIEGRLVRAAVIQEASQYQNKKGLTRVGVNNSIAKYFKAGQKEEYKFFPVAMPPVQTDSEDSVTSQTGFQV